MRQPQPRLEEGHHLHVSQTRFPRAAITPKFKIKKKDIKKSDFSELPLTFLEHLIFLLFFSQPAKMKA